MYVVMVHSDGQPDSYIFDQFGQRPVEYPHITFAQKAIQEHYEGDSTATYHIFQEVATVKPTFQFQPVNKD